MFNLIDAIHQLNTTLAQITTEQIDTLWIAKKEDIVRCKKLKRIPHSFQSATDFIQDKDQLILLDALYEHSNAKQGLNSEWLKGTYEYLNKPVIEAFVLQFQASLAYEANPLEIFYNFFSYEITSLHAFAGMLIYLNKHRAFKPFDIIRSGIIHQFITINSDQIEVIPELFSYIINEFNVSWLSDLKSYQCEIQGVYGYNLFAERDRNASTLEKVEDNKPRLLVTDEVDNYKSLLQLFGPIFIIGLCSIETYTHSFQQFVDALSPEHFALTLNKIDSLPCKAFEKFEMQNHLLICCSNEKRKILLEKTYISPFKLNVAGTYKISSDIKLSETETLFIAHRLTKQGLSDISRKHLSFLALKGLIEYPKLSILLSNDAEDKFKASMNTNLKKVSYIHEACKNNAESLKRDMETFILERVNPFNKDNYIEVRDYYSLNMDKYAVLNQLSENTLLVPSDENAFRAYIIKAVISSAQTQNKDEAITNALEIITSTYSIDEAKNHKLRILYEALYHFDSKDLIETIRAYLTSQFAIALVFIPKTFVGNEQLFIKALQANNTTLLTYPEFKDDMDSSHHQTDSKKIERLKNLLSQNYPEGFQAYLKYCSEEVITAFIKKEHCYQNKPKIVELLLLYIAKLTPNEQFRTLRASTHCFDSFKLIFNFISDENKAPYKNFLIKATLGQVQCFDLLMKHYFSDASPQQRKQAYLSCDDAEYEKSLIEQAIEQDHNDAFFYMMRDFNPQEENFKTFDFKYEQIKHNPKIVIYILKNKLKFESIEALLFDSTTGKGKPLLIKMLVNDDIFDLWLKALNSEQRLSYEQILPKIWKYIVKNNDMNYLDIKVEKFLSRIPDIKSRTDFILGEDGIQLLQSIYSPKTNFRFYNKLDDTKTISNITQILLSNLSLDNRHLLLHRADVLLTLVDFPDGFKDILRAVEEEQRKSLMISADSKKLGRTPLHFLFIEWPCDDIFEVLSLIPPFDLTFLLNIQDSKGQTPLAIAENFSDIKPDLLSNLQVLIAQQEQFVMNPAAINGI